MKSIGTVVKVKKGRKIPGVNIDMTGWRGRIIERDKEKYFGLFYIVEWDSITLDNISFKNIKKMNNNNIDWTKKLFGPEDIEKAPERDCKKDVKEKVSTIKSTLNNKKSNI